jgi:hypothetical protein
MAAITFDALIFSHKLTDAGMPREQADKFAEIQKEAFETQNQNLQDTLDKKISTHLATKEDIWNLRQDNAHLDKKISLLRKEFEGKFNLLYWMIGFTLAFCASNTAIIFKIYSHLNV